MNPWEKTENFDGKVKVYYDNLLNHFKRFNNEVFIESGTFIGNGLKCALDAGFNKCYSVEIHEHLYKKNLNRFDSEIKKGSVTLFHGDSGTILKSVIADLDRPATFWLDAHISSNYEEKLAKNCPVIEELEFIKNSSIKTHTILIDDLNCFGKEAHDYITLEQVKSYIISINPEYKFEFLDAAQSKNILVAYI
jgi:hypothetical protein